MKKEYLILFIIGTALLLTFAVLRSKSCGKELHEKLMASGNTHQTLQAFADAAANSSLKQEEKFVRISNDSGLPGAHQVLSAFQPNDSYGVACLDVGEGQWIVSITLFARWVWEKDGRIVIRPKSTSPQAFNKYIEEFPRGMHYSENMVGVCVPSKQ